MPPSTSCADQVSTRGTSPCSATFQIRERINTQFRCEAYNAFNHTQFSTVNSTARFDAAGTQINAALGNYTAARRPRYIQLALRLSF